MIDGEIITNAEFDYPFAGKTYKLKRASLRQVMEWQRKSMEINKEQDGATDVRVVAYALYLLLNKIDPAITEDYILDNAPGDINVIATLDQLGFMSQQKVSEMKKLGNSLANLNQPDGDKSLVQ